VTTTAPESTGTGDATYDEVIATTEKIKAKADAAMADKDLEQATQLADQLQQMIPDDSDTLGKAGELSAKVQEQRKITKELADMAEQLRDHTKRKYEGLKEWRGQGTPVSKDEFVAG